jgi:diacylglycerol kinase family enzyme
MHTLIIVNAQAGALLNQNVREFTRAVIAGFEIHGQTARVAAIEGKELPGAVTAASHADDVDRIIVAGGDGTIRSAAEVLMGSPKPLGIIPMGTLNRLARDLNIPLDPLQALSALHNAKADRIDLGSVNGTAFACQSLIGLPVLMATRRQGLRGKPIIERTSGMIRLFADVLQANRKKTITIEHVSATRRLRALSLAVVPNGYAEDMSLMLKRNPLDGGRLVLYASKHLNGLRTISATVKALLGRFKDDPDLEILSGARFSINSPHGKISVSNDGEVAQFSTPLEYQIHPKSLTILRPAST